MLLLMRRVGGVLRYVLSGTSPPLPPAASSAVFINTSNPSTSDVIDYGDTWAYEGRNSPFTITQWVRFDDASFPVSSLWEVDLFGQYALSDQHRRAFVYGVSPAVSGLYARILDDATNEIDVDGGPVILPQTPHFVCLEYDTININLYLDGALIGTNVLGAPSFEFSVDSQTSINGPTAPAPEPLNFRVDDVRFYSSALGLSDIGTLFSGGAISANALSTFDMDIDGDSLGPDFVAELDVTTGYRSGVPGLTTQALHITDFYSPTNGSYSINLAGPTAVTSDFSFAFWARTDTWPASSFWLPLFTLDSTGANPAAVQVSFELNAGPGSGNTNIIVNTSTTLTQVISGPGTITDAVWQHFALTFDYAATTLTTYIDGVSVGSDTGVIVGDTLDDMFIVCNSPLVTGAGSSDPMDAGMADLRFYSRVLSGADVADLASKIDVPGNLRQEFTFDGTPDNSAPFLTGVAGANVTFGPPGLP